MNRRIITVFVIVAGVFAAIAAPAHAVALNPAPPDFYSCLTGGGNGETRTTCAPANVSLAGGVPVATEGRAPATAPVARNVSTARLNGSTTIPWRPD